MESPRSQVAHRNALVVTAALVMGLAFMVAGAPDEAAAQGCETTNFAAGTSWSLCWEIRTREGLIIRTADYADRGGVSRRVLHRGSIAELHIPYHPGRPRFLDVTLSTTGLGARAQFLFPGECQGTLVGPKVCREIHDRGYAWKFGSTFQRGQEVTYWMTSQLGQYTYLTRWTFRDDGAIEPGLGLTGRLQVIRDGASYLPFGSQLNPESSPTPTVGIDHMHNVYWRLDLEINGTGHDAVDRLTLARHTGPGPVEEADCSVPGTCQVTRRTRIPVERAERLAPFRTWHQIDVTALNADGRSIGYELIPTGNQLWSGPTSEPWSAAELYVTRFNACEIFAVNNNVEAVNPGCAAAAPHVAAMVDGQDVDNADVVLWYVGHFLHVVRDEDQTNMLMHNVGFELQPRSWRHVNPLQ